MAEAWVYVATAYAVTWVALMGYWLALERALRQFARTGRPGGRGGRAPTGAGAAGQEPGEAAS